MPHSIDEPGVVKRLFAQKRKQIGGNLVVIPDVADVLFHIVKHPDDFDVCAAVARPLQGTQRSCDG